MNMRKLARGEDENDDIMLLPELRQRRSALKQLFCAEEYNKDEGKNPNA